MVKSVMIKDLIANFYELWGGFYLGKFSNLMYSEDLYLPVALYSILIALVLNVLYYYILNRPSTGNLKVWSLHIVLGCVINAIVAYVSSQNDLIEIFASENQVIPESFYYDMVIFAIINAGWTVILMFLLSLILKWKSPNSSYIPF